MFFLKKVYGQNPAISSQEEEKWSQIFLVLLRDKDRNGQFNTIYTKGIVFDEEIPNWPNDTAQNLIQEKEEEKKGTKKELLTTWFGVWNLSSFLAFCSNFFCLSILWS